MAVFDIRAGSVERGVVVSARAAELLRSTQRWELRCEYRPGELARSDGPTDHLDDEGVAVVGTMVQPGMILVRKLVPTRTDATRDASLRCPADVVGCIVDVRRAHAEIATVELSIEATRPLAIGDVLELDGARDVVAAIESDLAGDIVWPGLSGMWEIRKVACAVDLLEARHVGPYSLVTQQPLGGKAQWGGQRVTADDFAALRARGGSWIAHELLTVKSDDVPGRAALYESIARGAPACVSSDPRATRILERELHALAFAVDFDAERVEISLFDDAAIRERMPGVVTKPETLNYRTLAPEPGGLFCAAIFGAVGSSERVTRLGHLELSVPVLHPWALDAAARLLDRPLTDVLYGEQTFAGDPAERWQDTGPYAIREALAALDLDTLVSQPGARGELARVFIAARRHPRHLCFETWPVMPPDLRPLVPLDGGRFATSDLNDLYRRMINRANRLRRLGELAAPDAIMRNEVTMLQRAVDSLVENGLRQKKVTGPESRPLVSLVDLLQGERGRFALNLFSKRVDYSAAGSVVPDPLLAGDRMRVPRDLALELFRPFVFAALERAGIPSLREAKALVAARDPRALAALDTVVTERPLVVFAAEGTGPRVVTLEIDLWDQPAFAMAPAGFAALALGPAGRVVVHVPLDPRAVVEARQPSVRAADRSPPGWIARAATATRIGPVLFEAALRGEVDPVRDVRARMILCRRDTLEDAP